MGIFVCQLRSVLMVWYLPYLHTTPLISARASGWHLNPITPSVLNRPLSFIEDLRDRPIQDLSFLCHFPLNYFSYVPICNILILCSEKNLKQNPTSYQHSCSSHGSILSLISDLNCDGVHQNKCNCQKMS